MAKDPAFLFYPNDYMGGTMGMTFEEKGAYMDLLVLQFNKGAFTIDQAKKVLNGSFERLWPVLLEKFSQEGNKFFNQRLEIEKEKRASFTESRRKNRSSKNTSKTYDDTSEKHMSLHMENENENRNVNKDFGKSENLFDEAALVPKMAIVFKEKNPNYTQENSYDFPALKQIANFICKQIGISFQPRDGDVQKVVLDNWSIMSEWISKHRHYSNHNLQQVNKYIQSISTEIRNESTGSKTSGKPGAKTNGSQLVEAIAKFRGQKQPSGHT